MQSESEYNQKLTITNNMQSESTSDYHSFSEYRSNANYN